MDFGLAFVTGACVGAAAVWLLTRQTIASQRRLIAQLKNLHTMRATAASRSHVR